MVWMPNSSTTQAIDYTTFYPYFARPVIEYVFPEFGVIGLLGNLAIIYGMAKVKSELSPSLRFYYITLAVADFIDVSYYFGEFFEYGLWFYSGGTLRHLLINSSALSCKISTALMMGGDTVSGFTVVCLGVERFIAVTWPLRAKQILTLRFSVIFETFVCIVFLLLLDPLLVIVYNLEYVPFYWAPVCIWDLSLAVTPVYMAIEELMPILFTVPAFAITVYLTLKILRTTRTRHQLTDATGQSRAETGAMKLSARELSNVVTLIAISVMHLIVYIPYSFFFTVLSVLSNTAADESVVIIFMNIGSLFNQLVIVPHSMNVFVYLFRSRAFRVALFGERCACRRSKQQSSSAASTHL